MNRKSEKSVKNIENWSINSDGLVDVDGDVFLYNEGDLLCFNSPIFNIWKLISPYRKWDEDQMEFFEDCSIIQDDGESVAIDRLNFFLEEIGLDPVQKVDGYINI